MSVSLPQVSPRLQALLANGIVDRLPVSFASFCIEQMKDWEMLFPAERSYHERLFGLLDRSDRELVDRLFAPVRELEVKMGVNAKTFPPGQFTLQQVDFLNRNRYYPEWRAAIADVFGRLDPLLDAEIAHAGHSRLAIVLAPPDLAADPARMWLRVAERGKRVALDVPEDGNEFLPLLLTGAPRARKAPTIAQLFAKGAKGGPYSAWSVEVGSSLLELGTPSEPPVVHYSYQALDAYRKRLMEEVRKMVESQDIPGPRQLSAHLKQMRSLASEGEFARDPILAEFARAILLSGNGTLLVNNTFAEWATVQAVRRARPSVAVVGFGIRNKVKPFSSLLIYADQDATNPVPTQMDTLGTYVDLEIFYQYLWQEFEKYAEYRNNTAYLMMGDGMDEMLVIAPPDFPLLSAKDPVKLDAVFQHCKDWLNV